ncbi:hypothetical protein AB2L28_13620 [Kineococcus sp. TBRC 1896]|uniref:Uncharacterized protein n=1 Tax=Kineococcus mangrovi TaxID=1660183 RepID=A0ABV4I3M5_9ACTN
MAEYHDIDVPRKASITEKKIRERGSLGQGDDGAFGNAASGRINIEYQTTYELNPSNKVTASKIIDGLIKSKAVITQPAESITVEKDVVFELEGCTRITAASTAGKMLHIIRRLIERSDTSFDEVFALQADDPEVAEELRKVYLGNELLPIPVLMELTGCDLPRKIYINVRPNHFVDAASADKIEGRLRILGTVSHVIAGGPDGFLSAEEWLLNGYEYLFKRTLMTKLHGTVENLMSAFDLDLPADDVHGHITGPAIVLDAIAIY